MKALSAQPGSGASIVIGKAERLAVLSSNLLNT
jgi:hypothetical protein